VTTEEIRMYAQELEDVLGGVYTIQAQELQLPLVKRITHVMEQTKELKPLPPDLGVEPAIVTGFDALGRGHELNRMRNFFADISATFGPETLVAYVKREGAIKKFAVAHNVDIEDLIKTDDEVQQDQQMAAAQQMTVDAVSGAAGPAAGAAVKGIADAVNAQ
jgi:hypothetical protein